MSIIKTETNVPTLKINYLTQEMYDDALENDQINDNELYLTPSGSGGGGTPIPTADTVAEFDEDAHINSEDMSAQDVSDFVDGLDGQGANLADYVVEQGTSGIWTYRKWNSGIAECWGTTSGTYTISSTYGNLYYANGSVTYPSGLFTAVDNVSVCRSPSNTGGLIFFSAYGTLSTSTLAYYISSGRAESGLVIDISHYVIGRWK